MGSEDVIEKNNHAKKNHLRSIIMKICHLHLIKNHYEELLKLNRHKTKEINIKSAY